MKRKLLEPAKVKYLVVHASNTPAGATKEDVNDKLALTGSATSGFHFVIDKHGGVSKPLPTSVAGTHSARYDSESIGILLIGGRDSRGNVKKNFTKRQLVTFQALLKQLQKELPNAKSVGIGELAGGTNPYIDLSNY